MRPALNWSPASPATGRRGAGSSSSGCPTLMKVDPSRVDFRCSTLPMLIGYAFRISPDRVTGPEWMTAVGSPRFDIAATIPRGAPTSQVPEMLQALLSDRFKLVVHRRTASLPIYALVVARGGLKVEKTTPQAIAGSRPGEPEAPSSVDAFYGTVQSRAAPNAGAEFLTNPRMGTVRQTGDPGGVQRWEAPDTSLGGLADLLDKVAPLPLPVIDMTGLGGRYQLVLEVDLSGAHRSFSVGETHAAGDPGAEMEEHVLGAFNNGLLKLGLRLQRRKGPLETIVVDHVENTPTEN